jgi:hypothetical protein
MSCSSCNSTAHINGEYFDNPPLPTLYNTSEQPVSTSQWSFDDYHQSTSIQSPSHLAIDASDLQAGPNELNQDATLVSDQRRFKIGGLFFSIKSPFSCIPPNFAVWSYAFLKGPQGLPLPDSALITTASLLENLSDYHARYEIWSQDFQTYIKLCEELTSINGGGSWGFNINEEIILLEIIMPDTLLNAQQITEGLVRANLPSAFIKSQFSSQGFESMTLSHQNPVREPQYVLPNGPQNFDEDGNEIMSSPQTANTGAAPSQQTPIPRRKTPKSRPRPRVARTDVGTGGVSSLVYPSEI